MLLRTGTGTGTGMDAGPGVPREGVTWTRSNVSNAYVALLSAVLAIVTTLTANRAPCNKFITIEFSANVKF